jgi:hypothetical protein
MTCMYSVSFHLCYIVIDCHNLNCLKLNLWSQFLHNLFLKIIKIITLILVHNFVTINYCSLHIKLKINIILMAHCK